MRLTRKTHNPSHKNMITQQKANKKNNYKAQFSINQILKYEVKKKLIKE